MPAHIYLVIISAHNHKCIYNNRLAKGECAVIICCHNTKRIADFSLPWTVCFALSFLRPEHSSLLLLLPSEGPQRFVGVSMLSCDSMDFLWVLRGTLKSMTLPLKFSSVSENLHSLKGSSFILAVFTEEPKMIVSVTIEIGSYLCSRHLGRRQFDQWFIKCFELVIGNQFLHELLAPYRPLLRYNCF